MNMPLTLRRLRDRGFTLIELLIVILIIGILAAVALPSFLNQSDKAKDSEATQLVRNALSIVKGEIASNDGQIPSRTRLLNAYNASEEPDADAANTESFTADGRVYFFGTDGGNQPITIAARSKGSGDSDVSAVVISTDGTVDKTRLKISRSTAGGGGGGGSSLADMMTRDSAASYWPLNALPATDARGAVNGTVTGATIVPGKIGNAYRFDGDDHVNFGDVYDQDADNPTTFESTIEMWVRVGAGQFSGSMPLVENIHWNTTEGWQVLFNAGRVRFQARGLYAQPSIVLTPGSIQADTWTHVAISIENATAKIYIDGTEVISQALTRGIGFALPESEMILGDYPSELPTDGFVGDLDEVAIFNTALDASKIAEHAAATN